MDIKRIDPNLFSINGIEIEANDEQDAVTRYSKGLEKQVKLLTVKSNQLRADNQRYRARMGRKRLMPKEANEQMRELAKRFRADPEAFHTEAIDLLCVILKSCGYDLTVQTFKRHKKS